MRAVVLGLVLAVVAGCGGSDNGGAAPPPPPPAAPNLTGNWSVTIAATCQGTMSLNEGGSSVNGTLGCGGFTDAVNGTLSGSSSINLNLSHPGYQDALVTGTYTGSSISGTVTGSGFNGQTFTATKQ